MKPVDPEQIAAVIRECAQDHIMPRFKQLKPEQIRSKEHIHDLQTDADVDMEEALKLILPRILPGSLVIGEESVSKGTISTDALKTHKGDIWVTDPVDGTSNFAKGSEIFCSMLALVRNGEVAQCWIYIPTRDEMAFAARGEGAFLENNKLQTSVDRPLSQRNGFFDLRYFKKHQSPHLTEQRAKLASAYSLFCAGHEYLRIAGGNADFSIYSHMKPWDHLAGSLLVREAGGVVRKWDGSPYHVYDQKGGIMVASQENLWNETAEMILKPLLKDIAPGPMPS